MKDKRYSLLLVGLVLTLATSVMACSQPAPTPPPPLTVHLSPIGSPVHRGQVLEIMAVTRPDAESTLVIIGPGGSSLETKLADVAGQVSWTWRVPSTMTDGTWMVNIKSSHNGESALDATPITITKSESERNRELQQASAEANAKFQEMLPDLLKEFIDKAKAQEQEEMRRRGFDY